MPPTLEHNIINKYKRSVFSFILLFEKKSIINVIINAFGIEHINPEIIPLKLHRFEAINPLNMFPHAIQNRKSIPR